MIQTHTFSTKPQNVGQLGRAHSAEPVAYKTDWSIRGKARAIALVVAATTGNANATASPVYNFGASSNVDETSVVLMKRITQLRITAEEEEIPLSERSVSQLKRFLASNAKGRVPSIFLLPDGNLRAVWRTEKREQVALAFRPDGTVQFVIFAANAGGGMNRATGETAVSNIRQQVKASGAAHILKA